MAEAIGGNRMRWLETEASSVRIVVDEALPEIGRNSARAWKALQTIYAEFAPQKAQLLHHGSVMPTELFAALKRMVNTQNAGTADCRHRPSIFETERPLLRRVKLVIDGRTQPTGYTEYILDRRRRPLKASANLDYGTGGPKT